MPAVQKNCLYYGDNLIVLREHIKDESVDLIYLDPPFNSRQDYNVLFAERDGTRSASQIMGGWPTLKSADTTSTRGAPSFVIFEGWVPRTPTPPDFDVPTNQGPRPPKLFSLFHRKNPFSCDM